MQSLRERKVASQTGKKAQVILLLIHTIFVRVIPLDTHTIFVATLLTAACEQLLNGPKTSELTALLGRPLFIALLYLHPVGRETLFSLLSLVIFLFRSRAGCRCGWERTDCFGL